MAKNNYFDNDTIQTAIVEYKRKLEEEQIDDVTIMHPYTNQIQQLIRAVINTHKIYRFWYCIIVSSYHEKELELFCKESDTSIRDMLQLPYKSLS